MLELIRILRLPIKKTYVVYFYALTLSIRISEELFLLFFVI